MFEKKTYIYSENMGVCYIEDVTKLITARKTEVMYYVLRPVFRKEKTAYIPVENHSVELRELMQASEAKEEALEDPAFHPLMRELGFMESSEEETTDDEKDAGEEKVISAAESLRLEKQEEEERLAIQYKMADTLPIEQRSILYHRGEVEFVLRQYKREQIEEMHKAEKKGKKINRGEK